MFNNLSGKLKGWAYVASILGMIAAVLSGIARWTLNSPENNTIGLGVAVMICGIIASRIGGLVIYGFGEHLEQQATVARQMNGASTWKCPHCGHENLVSHVSCEECGHGK